MDRAVSHLGLGDAVRIAAEELSELRQLASEVTELRQLREQGFQDSKDLAALRVEHKELELEKEELRGARDQLNRVLVEKDEVQESNARLVAAQRGLEKVVAGLQHQQRVLVDHDLATARKRCEEAETKLALAVQERDSNLRSFEAAGREIAAQKVSLFKLERSIEFLSKPRRKKSPDNQASKANMRRPQSASSAATWERLTAPRAGRVQ